ncbi:bifunctional 4-hydroxy-3-methylbut-2-enyl diphosphate reductase/30S ribosomal protein S1 [Clostridium omnivorum]|uniref:bifunctional 4-hydroxy-3-methylbut-2-enyl diphosphate reductase/30S ribosomal protein S1 n=1 Tax=Clostridium omnivorum TaxID=1604902 RepID=UPI002232C0F4|nr:bifunctional 4-hydroxy-3-methylbut-2-enyl diphosphate reductase/30S ribosomal protein S1 [Clostridium sp. E14]
MEVILAEKAGFCFGVKRAVDEAVKVKEKYNKKIYTLGPLIHNKDVVEYLKEKEIFPIEINDINALTEGDVVIIRSHGVTPETFKLLEDKNIIVVNATCPYVSNIQQKVKKYYDLGYSVIIIGDSNHPEVIGINGWCENKAIIAKSGEELKEIPKKVCVVSQTTEKQQNWESVLSEITKTAKEIIAFNTICSATETRQKSAEELSKVVDVMIVIGGYNSSNTTKLFEICKSNCSKTIHVENVSQIPKTLLHSKVNLKIGVTAGASTPDWIIKEAILEMSDQELNFNEQQAFMDQNDVSISVGKIIKGEVISVNEKEAFVNIGYKADGYLPKNEVTKDENVKLTDILNKGDVIEVKVISRKNEDGYVVLSRVELERMHTFEFLKDCFENKKTINVVIKESLKGGVIASYKGIRVFIPASHLELHHVNDLSKYIGKEVEIQIIEFSEQTRNTRIVGSRREMLTAAQLDKEEAAWSTINKGDVVEGEVKRLTAFGAFVDVKGIDGLLHVSEISWGRINKPSDVLKPGDIIKVMILDLDKETKKLSLSIKKLAENPWIDVDAKYPVGSIVLGKVVRFADFGAFVELEPGVDALVHISQISNEKIKHPSDVLQVGQSVKAKITDVNKEGKKIGLSIRAVDEI